MLRVVQNLQELQSSRSRRGFLPLVLIVRKQRLQYERFRAFRRALERRSLNRNSLIRRINTSIRLRRGTVIANDTTQNQTNTSPQERGGRPEAASRLLILLSKALVAEVKPL